MESVGIVGLDVTCWSVCVQIDWLVGSEELSVWVPTDLDGDWWSVEVWVDRVFVVVLVVVLAVGRGRGGAEVGGEGC